MTRLDEIKSSVTLVGSLPAGIELAIAVIERLHLPQSTTLEELKEALNIAYAAAYRLKLEAAGWPDEHD